MSGRRQIQHHTFDSTNHLNCDISLCNFTHVEAYCWNHVLIELTRLKQKQMLSLKIKQYSQPMFTIHSFDFCIDAYIFNVIQINLCFNNKSNRSSKDYFMGFTLQSTAYSLTNVRMQQKKTKDSKVTLKTHCRQPFSIFFLKRYVTDSECGLVHQFIYMAQCGL